MGLISIRNVTRDTQFCRENTLQGQWLSLWPPGNNSPSRAGHYFFYKLLERIFMKTLSIIFFILLITKLAAAQTKQEIINMITAEATKQGLDPKLAVAIATVESSLNPKAVGLLKEQGLYQLRPQYHALSGDVKNNIRTAIKYLIWIKNKSNGKHGDAWFVLFNYGPYNAPMQPTKTKYYIKVMKQLKSNQMLAIN